ncbi:MAG: hypothetical protein R2822_19990 [Spirosomataceae bacterium]
MNDTERFDDWVRSEIESLDTAPENFRQDALWQQLQGELHPKKQQVFLSMRWVSIAAAIALFLLACGLWWRFWPESAVVATIDMPSNIQPKKPTVPLPAFEKAEPQAKEKRAQKTSPKTQNNQRPAQEENKVAEKIIPLENFEKPIIQIESIAHPEIIVAEVTTPTQPSVEMPKVAIAHVPKSKPYFKIVHANELTDYQRTEEAKAKEIQTQKFVVIHWQTSNSPSPTQNSLMSYIKKKSE